MKCLRALVPWEVAEAGGEAAPDQEMAHLLLAEELCGISRSEELEGFLFCSLRRRIGPQRPDPCRYAVQKEPP